nr:hypothetical protein [Alteromonas macleodii]|tara:strand:- start:94 stop:516 length:423 start_codon:yes stop_codon:yes gene_type:complete
MYKQLFKTMNIDSCSGLDEGRYTITMDIAPYLSTVASFAKTQKQFPLLRLQRFPFTMLSDVTLKENGIEVALGEIVHTALFRYLITLKLKDNEDNGDDPIVNITFTWADSLNVHEMSASTDLTMSEIEEYVTIGTFEEVM